MWMPHIDRQIDLKCNISHYSTFFSDLLQLFCQSVMFMSLGMMIAMVDEIGED